MLKVLIRTSAFLIQSVLDCRQCLHCWTSASSFARHLQVGASGAMHFMYGSASKSTLSSIRAVAQSTSVVAASFLGGIAFDNWSAQQVSFLHQHAYVNSMSVLNTALHEPSPPC